MEHNIQKEVYEPIKALKDRFYNSKTQDEWDGCKAELVELLRKAESLMTPDFFPKYKQGVVDAVSKMFSFKEKYFKSNGARPIINKSSFIFQDNLATALTKYIELQTKLLELEYETKCHAINQVNYN